MTDNNTAIDTSVEATTETIEASTETAAPTQPKRKDFSNLRNRPFLVVYSTKSPVKKTLTSRKGWADTQGNWKITERPEIVDRVSDKILREATVIIDVTRSTCLTKRFDHISDAEVVHHYMTKFGEYVKEAMGVWLRKMAAKMAQDPSFARNLAEKATEQALAESMTPPADIEAYEVVADEQPATATNEG